jgi:mannobiose 2-epimerase
VGYHGLPELYTEDWSPLPTAEGGRVDIGHQFEWAYLLSAAVERDFPQAHLSDAFALLDYGLRVGYDAGEGGIFADASLAGEVIRPQKGWWQQCEAARAMMHFAALRGRDDLWEPLERTVAFIRREFVDPEYGGWYAGRSREKGNPWKVDYHVVGMRQEAMRLNRAADGPHRQVPLPGGM